MLRMACLILTISNGSSDAIEFRVTAEKSVWGDMSS